MSEQCLLCADERVEVLRHQFRRCRDCGFLFVTPAERVRQQAEFNQVSERVVDRERVEGLMKKYPKDDHRKRALYERMAKRVIEWYGPSVRVLDVGASGGFFLRAVEERGASRAALRDLEIEPTYLELTKEYFGYEGDVSNIETYQPTKTFEVVSMFDVLEHVSDFWRALGNIHAMLAPEGRLILKLPNANWVRLKYFFALLTGRSEKIPYYLYLEPGGHLNYWNRRSIKRLERAGFVLESFEYIEPTKQQFGRQYPWRKLGYCLNKWLRLDLFPEFLVVLRKRG